MERIFEKKSLQSNAKQWKTNKKGSALAYVLVIMTAVMIIMVSMLGYISSQLKFSFNRVEREEAFQIAESGVYFYRWYLAHETSGKTAKQIESFWNGTVLGAPTAYEADYEGIGRYSIEVTRPNSGSTIIVVKATGWTYKMPNVKRTVQVRFRRPSWSEYIFLSNSFMNFGNEATVYGKVHSNGGIRFDGVAYNTVSSLLPRFNDATYGGNRMEFGVHTTVNPADGAAPSYPWADGTVPDRPDIFAGGREFPVPEVSFSGVTADLANMKTQAADSAYGKYFDGTGLGRRINLKNDGTYDVCTVLKANPNTHAITKYLESDGWGECNSCSGACLSNYSIVNNGLIFVEDNVWLEGSIDSKRLTIVSANLSGGGSQTDIYIGISNAHLRLAAYDCDNMLGLIAQRDILVLHDCPSDFIVDAALLAQTGKVGIVDGMGGKYSLTFNGAIASYLQPYFQSGYSGFSDRTYNFNNNLLYCPPPYFPTGTEYSIDLWEEVQNN